VSGGVGVVTAWVSAAGAVVCVGVVLLEFEPHAVSSKAAISKTEMDKIRKVLVMASP
jgi:hypothetical protein